jgi:hypothetical protein
MTWRLSRPVLVAAIVSLPLLVPGPARAAVATHTYVITGGISFGVLNIGSITGGSFTVQFPSTPCVGPSPATCPASLFSGVVSGTLGTLNMLPYAAIQNAGDHTGNVRAALWFSNPTFFRHLALIRE